jgi:hypothetical protein
LLKHVPGPAPTEAVDPVVDPTTGSTPIVHPPGGAAVDDGGFPRRLQIADLDSIQMTLRNPPITNLGADTQLQVSKDTVIHAYAGIEYSNLEIISIDGSENPLGEVGMGTVAKMIPIEETICNAFTESVTGEPLDGLTTPVGLATTLNDFVGPSFPYAGQYKLCYRKQTDGPWDILPHIFDVKGGVTSDAIYWCIYILDPGDENWNDFPCKIMVDRVGQTEDQDYNGDLIPDRDQFPWKVALAEFGETDCGVTITQGFDLKVGTVVTSEALFQVHNFNYRRGGTTQEPEMFKVCYCVGPQGFNSNEVPGDDVPCSVDHPGDFPQTIGTLVLIRGEVKSKGLAVTVYPTLMFDIELTCGNQPGGCAGDTGARYKIVVSHERNQALYFEEGGCRISPQAPEQLAPFNCNSPADCNDLRDENPVSKHKPMFKNVQVDATRDNMIMIEKAYQICYCNSACYSNRNWFKVSDFIVKPVAVSMVYTQLEAFDILGIVATTRRLGPNPKRRLQQDARAAAVNTPGYIVVYGTVLTLGGAWAQDTDGTVTRELKILPDNDGLIARDSCLELSQSSLYISGHVCSEITDCETPDYSTNKGQIYGERTEAGDSSGDIQIRQAGFAAICYCDRICNEIQNWFVAGRILVAGPTGGQTWVFSVGVAFSMDIQGIALEEDNYAIVIDGASECGVADPSFLDGNVFGPQLNPKLIVGGTANKILSMGMDEFGRGVRIDFTTSHGLLDGDMITLKDIESKRPGATEDRIASEDAMINTAHKVALICDGLVDGVDCFAIAIPIFFTSLQDNDIFLDNALWHRSNIETFNDIRGVVANTYKVCWSQQGPQDDYSTYVGTAGMLVITEPPLLDAGLGMTSIEPNVGAPFIIYFTTGDKGKYSEAEGSMQLKFVFQDRSYLRPLKRDNSEADVCSSASDPCPTVHDRSQVICGTYITEVWSDDPNGFPHPDGCYLSIDETAGTDAAALYELYVIFSPMNGLRAEKRYEVVMNGMPGPLLSEEEPGNGAVHVWSMDDAFNNPYEVVEFGRASANKAMAKQIRDETKGDAAFLETSGFKIVQPGNPALTGGGFHEVGRRCANDAPKPCGICYSEDMCRIDPTSDAGRTFCIGVIDKACPQDQLDAAAIQFALSAKAGNLIMEKMIVRVFLMPLTQWNIANRCVAQCTAHPETSCGGDQTPEPTCEVESVIGGLVIQDSEYNINTLKITMPEGMTPISSTTSHTVKVSALEVPDGGFLPIPTPAELSDAQSEKPHFWGSTQVAASGLMMYMEPRVVSASIVTKPGDGNEQPFRGDVANTLYLKIVSGTTWYSDGDGQVKVTITLPCVQPKRDGEQVSCYKCKMDGQSHPVPDTLGVLGAAIPSTRGLLGMRLEEGLWETGDDEGEPPTCNFLMQQSAVWYARSSIYMAIEVDNPILAMSQTDPDNYWKASITGSGGSPAGSWNIPNTDQVSAEGLQYLSEIFSGTGDFSASVSVLGKLSHEIVAPTDFAYSSPTNDMMIFFRTEQEVGLKTDIASQIWVDAPEGYDFGRYCLVQHLPSSYYVPEPEIPTQPIPVSDLIECNGEPRLNTHYTYTRAKIFTVARLLSNSGYGFYLRVKNPSSFLREMTNEWKIFTYTQREEGVDGSFQTVRLNAQTAPGDYMSWGPYRKSLPAEYFQVAIPDLRPTAYGGAAGADHSTEITVFPVQVTGPSDGNVRILAPAGFRWSFTESEFIYRSVSSGAPPSQAVIGADRDFPLSLVPTNPIIEPFNELRIEYLREPFMPGYLYGFRTKIRVPGISPSNAPNAFTLELGYDERDPDRRTEACMIVSPLVQALINGAIGYRTNIKERMNTVIFSVQVVTRIPRDGGLVFVGPPEFRFGPPEILAELIRCKADQLAEGCEESDEGAALECSPKAEIGFPEIPYDSSCSAQVELGSMVPTITITAGPSGIPARMYKLAFSSINPASLRGLDQEGSWEVSSYQVVSEETMLDAPTTIKSFRINAPMQSAMLVPTEVKPCRFREDFEDPDDVVFGPDEDCIIQNWQYFRTGRSDKPYDPSALIFTFVLSQSTADNEDTQIVLHGPIGFEFPNECIFESRPTHVFWRDNPGTDIPPNFDDDYKNWPTSAELRSCFGQMNTATVVVGPGLKSKTPYVFRISVKNNPKNTPEYNYWLLEVGQETSEPMEGFVIWAFRDTMVVPRDVAMSERYKPVPSPVDIFFRPFTNIEPGGRLAVQAPSGFRIETECRATLEPVVDPGNATIETPDIVCQGDINPSNNGQVLLPGAENGASNAAKAAVLKNTLISGQLYKLTIEVANPQSVSAARDWQVMSYKTLELTDLADKSFITGYSVSYRVMLFGPSTDGVYNAPATVSGTMEVLLTFEFAFPQSVVSEDRIVLDAPFGFVLNKDGRNDCMEYRHMIGFLKRTIPTCGANRMTWHLKDELLPENNPVTVQFKTINPSRTPATNFFAIKHLKPDDSIYASRLIQGYVILPQLRNVEIYLADSMPKIGQIARVPMKVQEAILSDSTVVVKFRAESDATHVRIVGMVEGAKKISYFDFSEVTVPTKIDIVEKTKEHFVGLMQIRAVPANLNERRQVELETQVTMYHVRNPDVDGQTYWDITTYMGSFDYEYRMDQRLQVVGFPILGRLTLKPTSAVRPNFYGTRRSVANFNFESSVQLVAGDVLYLKRPGNFEYYNQTLVVKRFITVVYHGIMNVKEDPDAEPGTKPEDEGLVYIIKLGGPTPPDTEVGISIDVVLPEEPRDILDENTKNRPEWLIECHDGDGVPKATNDYLFPGFLLVGQIPFYVEPGMKTPGALNYMQLQFNLPQTIEAEQEVKIILTAPSGFQFQASCLAELNLAFLKCSGAANVATLTSATRTVNAQNHKLVLLGNNAPETPSYNIWKLAAFKDESTQFINYSEWSGFSLTAMLVAVKGNNQKGASGPLFFTITPANTAERKATLLVTPPPKQGYRMNCRDAYRVGLPVEPACSTTGAPDAEIILTLDNSTIVAGIEYTFSVGVLNPGTEVDKSNNMWAVSLKDRFGAVVDSNRNIQGLTLKHFPAKVQSLAWSEVLPATTSRVRISIYFTKMIDANMLDEIKIASPDGVMFSDPNSAAVQPDKFPLLAQQPFTAAGNMLTIGVDSSQFFEAGIYEIFFEVKNPSKRLPNDNTWMTALLFDQQLLFTHVQPGYAFGEPSPFVIGMPFGTEADAFLSRLGLMLACVLWHT